MGIAYSNPKAEEQYLRDQAARQSIKAASDPDPRNAQRAADAAAKAAQAAAYKSAEIQQTSR